MIIIVFSKSIKLIGPIITSIISAIPSLLGGGGKIEKTSLMLTDTATLLGGGGNTDARTEQMLTSTVILSLGSL